MDHVRELEQQLYDLRLIREAEKVIDGSYREVVTPRVWPQSRWVTTWKESKQRVQQSSVAIPLDIGYAPLDTVGSVDRSGGK